MENVTPTSPAVGTQPAPSAGGPQDGGQKPLVHELSVQTSPNDFPMKKTFIIFGLVIIAGIISGFAASYISKATGSSKSGSTEQTALDNAKVVETAGVSDKKTFKDSAEGILREGGDENGEGSFHLERPGGEDQTAYLASSTVDLSKYIGKKVRVHGETFSSQHVAWLMDVGYVEVLK